MATLKTSNVQPNEIVKADDIQHGFDSVIENLRIALSMAYGNSQNWIIGGKIIPKIGGQGLQCSIENGLMGFNASTKDFFVNDDFSDFMLAFESEDYDRIATVAVKSELSGIEPQQRAFLNQAAGVVTYQDTYTKQERELIFNIQYSEPVQANAPDTPAGYIKIAEIVIPANSTMLDDITIYNCTSDIDTEDNIGWTNEKRATINIGQLSRLIKMFRNKHNQDGDFKQNAIKASQIITDNTTGSLTSSHIPLGDTISESDNGNLSTVTAESSTKINVTIKQIANLINELYRGYIENGAYVATDDIQIRKDNVENNVKIEYSDTGTIQFKIGSSVVCEIDNTSVYVGQKQADNANKLVTKSDLAFDTTVNSSSTNNNAPTSLAVLNAIRNIAVPIGYIYTQYPNQKAPATLFGFGTWTELNFGGAFFRSNRGTMNNTTNTKPSSPEAAQLPNIKGAIRLPESAGGGDNFLTDNAKLSISGAFGVEKGTKLGMGNTASYPNMPTGLTFDASKSNSTYGDGYEVRPKNYTIKIWQRTA